MTDKAAEKLTSDGWSVVETSGFLNLVGPPVAADGGWRA